MEISNYAGLCIDGPLEGGYYSSAYDLLIAPVSIKVEEKYPTGVAKVTYRFLYWHAMGKKYGIWVSDDDSIPLFAEKVESFREWCWLVKGLYKKKIFPLPFDVKDVPDWVWEDEAYQAVLKSYHELPGEIKPQGKLTPVVDTWQYHWYFVPRHDRDQYDFFVVRYPAELNSQTYLQYQDEHYNLTKDGQWVKSDPAVIMEPCFSINGMLVHVLGTAGAIRTKRESMADLLTELVDHIVNNTVTELLESDTNAG